MGARHTMQLLLLVVMAASCQQALADRLLQQICSAGQYAVGSGCQSCGYGAYCPGGAAPRIPCGMFLTTLSTTASAATQCVVASCNPCASTTPDVLVSTGSGSTPSNALWRIRGFDATQSTQSNIEYLCSPGTLNNRMIGDIAVLHTGDVLIMDIACSLFVIPVSVYNAMIATPFPMGISCQAIPVQLPVALSLPASTSCTGLSVGFKTNLLTVTTNAGVVHTLQVNTDAKGAMTAQLLSSFYAVCDPLQTGMRCTTGGTDATPGPDFNMYRWTGKDSSAAYGAGRLLLNPVTQVPDGRYVLINRNISVNSVPSMDQSYMNAGVFCTASGVYGTAARTVTGNVANFFALDISSPGSNTAAGLTQAPLVSQSPTLTSRWLLVNGAAAVRPVCVPPKYLSLQIKYPSCLSGQANKTQPTLQVFRVDNLPNVSVCNVVNSAASTVTNGTGPISPPDASSLCTNVNTLMPNVTYKVALGPNNSAVATYQSVSCYDMSNPASPVNITNADGSFTTKNPPVDITCVVNLGPGVNSTTDTGYWLGNGTVPTCTVCGIGFACPGVPPPHDRYPCPLEFLTTTTNTSGSCDKPYNCNPCPDATPDVVFSVGTRGSPANGIFMIRNYTDTANQPVSFLCKLSLSASTSVGDVAMLWTGQLILVMLNGDVYQIPAAQMATYIANPDPFFNRTCQNVRFQFQLATGSYSWTGLGTGQLSNILLATASNGDILTIQINVNAAGDIFTVGASTLSAPCDPNNPGDPSSNGGTDITAHPDGSIYRYCARDAQNHAATATRLTLLLGSFAQFSPVISYTNRQLNATVNQTLVSNAGSFCSSSAAYAASYSSDTVTYGAFFFRMDNSPFWLYPTSPPNGSWVNLPPMQQVGSSVVRTGLRINGATNRPICTVI